MSVAFPPCPTDYDDGCVCETCLFFAVEHAYFAWLKVDAQLCLEDRMCNISGTGESREAGWAA